MTRSGASQPQQPGESMWGRSRVLPASVPTTLWAERRKPPRTSLILVAAEEEEEAAAREFTVTPQPQASCPKPGGAPRFQVRWLPLPALQGYLRWAFSALSLNPSSFSKVPSKKEVLLQSLEWPSRRLPTPHSSLRWENPKPGQDSLAQVHTVCCSYTAVTRLARSLVARHYALLPHPMDWAQDGGDKGPRLW